MAEKAGYTNVKVYVDGTPAWRKAGQLVVVNNTWLAKNLDSDHVIIDARPASKSSKEHIKTAVAIDADRLTKMGLDFKAKKVKSRGKTLPFLADKNAPIILYGDNSRSEDVLSAFKELIAWGYKKVVVLNGGFDAWLAKELPTETGAARTKIVYVKKLVQGAISPAEFRKLQVSGGAVILDIRTDQESANGRIPNSVHIPCDTLEANLDRLSKSDKIFIHCSTGIRAEIAYNTLKNKGFTDVGFLNSVIKIHPSGTYQIGAEATGGAVEEMTPITTAEKPICPRDPSRCALMIRAGQEYRERGKYKEAKEAFRQAVQADPQSAKAWHFYDTCVVWAIAKELEKQPSPPAGATTSDRHKEATTGSKPTPPPDQNDDEGC